jgi:WD40 repeat protein
VLRRPAAKFGSSAWSVAGGGQAATYSLDSRQLIVGGQRGAIRFLSAETGEVQRVLKGGDDEILSLAIIPKSQILISAGADRTVRLWDLSSFQEVKRLHSHRARKGIGFARWQIPCTGTQLWKSNRWIRYSFLLRAATRRDIPLWSLSHRTANISLAGQPE